MKVYDWIILAVFAIALIVLAFFQKCSLDIYFLIVGAVIAVLAAVSFLIVRKKFQVD